MLCINAVKTKCHIICLRQRKYDQTNVQPTIKEYEIAQTGNIERGKLPGSSIFNIYIIKYHEASS